MNLVEHCGICDVCGRDLVPVYSPDGHGDVEFTGFAPCVCECVIVRFKPMAIADHVAVGTLTTEICLSDKPLFGTLHPLTNTGEKSLSAGSGGKDSDETQD